MVSELIVDKQSDELMNKLAAMKAFCLICEQGSFAGAAGELGISATMVSRYIKQLEQELGCLLLKRNTRQLFLTEAGEQYRQQVSPLLKRLALIERQMTRHHDEPRGQLTLSTSIEFGGQYLAPLIARYRAAYPRVSLNVNLCNTPVNLLDDQTDLAFRVAPELPDASYIAQPVCTTRLALWASPNYLARQGMPWDIDALREHQLLFFSHSIRSDQWLFNQDGQRRQLALPWAWRSNNGRLLNEAAAAGQGIIQAPTYSVAEFVDRGELVEVMPEHSIDNLVISAIYPHRYELSIRVKTFVEMAKQYFVECPPP